MCKGTTAGRQGDAVGGRRARQGITLVAFCALTIPLSSQNNAIHHSVGKRNTSKTLPFKLSVGATCRPEILEINGLFTQGSRPGRTVGGSVGGIFEMDL